MLYTIEELLQEVYKEVYRVYDIFKNFFGEDYVDLQDVITPDNMQVILHHLNIGQIENTYEVSDETLQQIKRGTPESIIMVWWPSVTVTNEYNKSVNIQDLFAKIPLTIEGQIPWEKDGFTLNRSTYTEEQYNSDYMHSHIPGINKSDLSVFLRPCLGSGPIRNTINTLRAENDEASWMLFCQELALYVTVESLSGIPYRKLESIGTERYQYELDYSNVIHYDVRFVAFDTSSPNAEKEQLKDFIKFYLKNNHLKFGFKKGAYVIDTPINDCVLDISNAFIKYFNTYWASSYPINRLFSEVLVKCVWYNNKWREYNSSGTIPNEIAQGNYICVFKGEEKRLRITEVRKKSDPVSAILLKPYYVMPILKILLQLINYNYEYPRNQRTSEEGTSTNSEAIYFI